jgi:hypothetical protein
VAEISAGAWAYSKSDQLEELVRDTVTTTVRQEYGVVQSRTDTFDQIQKGVRKNSISISVQYVMSPNENLNLPDYLLNLT